jgi:hypothetical protein
MTVKKNLKNQLQRYCSYFGGDQPQVAWIERFRSVLEAFLGLVLVLTMANTLVSLEALVNGS